MGAKVGEKYYKADAVIVRDVNNIRIVCYDKESIYVRSEKGIWVVFHRWFAQRGSYNGGWLQFRHQILKQKKLTFTHCYHLAFMYDISAQLVSNGPDLSKCKIQMRF